MARVRKPTPWELQQIAKALLKNEIENQKGFLDAAEKRIDEITSELTSIAGTAKIPKRKLNKLNRELDEKREAADRIRKWLEKNGVRVA